MSAYSSIVQYTHIECKWFDRTYRKEIHEPREPSLHLFIDFYSSDIQGKLTEENQSTC